MKIPRSIVSVAIGSSILVASFYGVAGGCPTQECHDVAIEALSEKLPTPDTPPAAVVSTVHATTNTISTSIAVYRWR